MGQAGIPISTLTMAATSEATTNLDKANLNEDSSPLQAEVASILPTSPSKAVLFTMSATAPAETHTSCTSPMKQIN